MRTSIRRTIRLMIVTNVLVLSLVMAPLALAETITAVEGPWTMYTNVVVHNCCGPDDYYGVGDTTSSGSNTSLEIQIRGWNNSINMHQVSSNACYSYPGSTCHTAESEYVSSDTVPTATVYYAASDHLIYYPVNSGGGGGSLYEYYTSTDGNHSNANCVYNGC